MLGLAFLPPARDDAQPSTRSGAAVRRAVQRRTAAVSNDQPPPFTVAQARCASLDCVKYYRQVSAQSLLRDCRSAVTFAPDSWSSALRSLRRGERGLVVRYRTLTIAVFTLNEDLTTVIKSRGEATPSVLLFSRNSIRLCNYLEQQCGLASSAELSAADVQCVGVPYRLSGKLSRQPMSSATASTTQISSTPPPSYQMIEAGPPSYTAALTSQPLLHDSTPRLARAREEWPAALNAASTPAFAVHWLRVHGS